MGCGLEGSSDVDLAAQRQLPPLAKAEEHARVKVMVINFDPIVQGNLPLSTVRGFHGASDLVPRLKDTLHGASYGGIAFDIVNWTEEGFPPRDGGHIPTYQEHVDCLNTGKSCYDHQLADYPLIATKHRLCERVASQEIDEVWMISDTGSGFYESRMVGKGAFWVNAPPLWTWRRFECERPFIMMGFNFARDITEMLHNFGHRIDDVIDHAIKTKRSDIDLNMAEIFTRPYTSNGTGGCGTTHFPPNITDGLDYQYQVLDAVPSECDKVGPIPNPQAPLRTINCNEWGCYEWGYHTWRFARMPRTRAVNWWRQVFPEVTFAPGQAAYDGPSY